MKYYSFWSGELQGRQEVIMENFQQEPTFSNAVFNLVAIIKMRADFVYFKKRKMIDGELLPFDWRLVRNVFVGMKNSAKMKLKRSDTFY